MSTAVAERPVAETKVRAATPPHFTVNKSDLVRELTLAIGSVEKKTTIPILANVCLSVTSENSLVILATDLELAISTRCSAGVRVLGAATLPAKKLLDFVRLLPDGEIDLKFDARHWVTITAGRSKTRIAGMSTESFPTPPMPVKALVRLPLAALNRMIASVQFAVSTEESRFTLQGCLVEVGDQLRMIATDGHRLALVESPIKADSAKVLLPRQAMLQIAKLHAVSEGMAEVDLGWDDNYISFIVGTRTLTTRRLTGSFPDYARVVPKDFTKTVIANRQQLRESLGRVRNFADDRSHAVQLSLASGSLKVRASLTETGESEETVPVDFTGDQLVIGFNADYLIHFLDAASTERVRLLLSTADRPLQMEPVSEDGQGNGRYFTVVMPIRL